MLLIAPFGRLQQSHQEDGYADWLRSRLGNVTSEAVEFALSTALEQDMDDLSHFVETFVQVYTEASQRMEAASISTVALVALLQHRYLLLDNAVTPHLWLKSALTRTLNGQARAGSVFATSFEKTMAVRFGQLISTFDTLISPLFSEGRTNPISPRAP